MSSAANSRLLTVKEAAAYLRCGVSTLNKLRVSGGGPMYVKMHGRVFYKLDTLDRYITRHEIRSTAHERSQAA
jgi:excisionase family DNA binding protein